MNFEELADEFGDLSSELATEEWNEKHYDNRYYGEKELESPEIRICDLLTKLCEELAVKEVRQC